MLGEIVLLHLAAMASPGPNVLLVTHSAAAVSRRAGLWAAAGVAIGAAVWAGSVAVGLGLVLERAPAAERAIRIVGGLYLVVLGLRTVSHATDPVRADPDGWGEPSARRAFLRGGLTNLSNPKAAVFYVSVFGAVLPADASDGLRAAAVAVILVDALVWHAALALAFSTAGAQAGYARAKRRIDRIAGSVMAAFGLLLASGAA